MRLTHLPLIALSAFGLLAGTIAAPIAANAQDRDRGVRAERADHGGDRHMRNDRSRDRTVRVDRDRDRRVTTRHVTTRHVVRRHVHRHHDDRFVVRSTAISVPFVVLGTPVTYAAYGAGYCRALHRGHHWAPRIGWHSGRHVGRVRC